jgi:CubicO group peptidase (beta-lactamase class C family)
VVWAFPLALALVAEQPAADLTSGRPVGTSHPNGSCPLVDSAALEQFVDERFGKGLEDRLFPGAVFAFVQDGRIVLSKGFGIANVATGAPVDPEKTRFYAGSLTKLVTATAVMQLVDRGQVDLDVDVNRYLTSIQIDSNFPEPVTLRHLLTHTGGLDRRDIGMGSPSPESILSLEQYLQRDLTERVEPPGTAFRYSNLGMAIAGLVVQEVTGIPFAQYVRDSIFLPLGMHGSTVGPPEHDPNLSPGYLPLRRRTGWREARHIYFHNTPAIGLRTTAHDMARFAIAHLNGGVLDGRRILSDSAAAMMQELHFRQDPRLPGSGLGFRITERLGLRISGHRGLMNQHASIIDMIPDANAAFFVACNASDCSRMESMIDDLLERFLCGTRLDSAISVLSEAMVPASELVGVYRPKRQAKRSVEKARALFDEMKIEARGDTIIVVDELHPHNVRRLVPTGPDEYALVRGGGRLILKPGEDGPRLFFSGLGLPQEELVRLSYVETRSFFKRMSLASTAGLASAIVLLPAMAAARRWRGSPGGRGAGLAAAAGGTILAALLLAFLLGMQRVLGGAVETEFLFGVPANVRALLWLPVGAILAWLALAPMAVQLWRKRLWTLVERIYLVCMLAGCVALFALLSYWNMIGPQI